MLYLKNFINFLISLTSQNIYCFSRSIIEKILYKKDRSLFYKNGYYFRKYHDNKKLIFFPDKERSRLFGKGYEYRLKTLGKMYLLNLIRFDHGDIVIDCGANIGEIKLIFDNLKKKISYFAFEPGTKEFKCLKKNISSGKLINRGLWKSNTFINFYEKTDTADSSFVQNNNFDKISTKKVIRLDSYSFKKIKLFKVEAEGAEPEVILGAKKILKNIEFISVDCGPERGFNSDTTDKHVKKILLKNNFKLIKKSCFRDVYLFKNLKY